jgi:hypothetical protein
MVECWNIGFQKGISHFNFMSIPPVAGLLIQHCIILSEPEASTHYSRTHDSNVPEFQHSNMGEAPNLWD